ncbi:MAG: tetratricopeptide repeat protein, partial [Bacillota bacterium]
EIDALRAKGLRHLNREEFEEAERVFRKLVKTDPSPASRNNLAMCRFRRGDREGALRVLKPNLEADLPNPFAHALAAQALAALGRKEDAEAHLPVKSWTPLRSPGAKNSRTSLSPST